ncbi:hypothetical protein BHM03_00000356 [Ensete ventricosum]|uniref:Uncharacterized protein n=1 Tax=Ensete ventricosum TaxID=4639 RepID=A0A445M8E2_ENSVE|nr:hypothetical protein BHM03_00000356 [Ensete ventricosum]
MEQTNSSGTDNSRIRKIYDIMHTTHIRRSDGRCSYSNTFVRDSRGPLIWSTGLIGVVMDWSVLNRLGMDKVDMKQIWEKGLLKAPNPMRTRFEEHDRERYYRFHRDYEDSSSAKKAYARAEVQKRPKAQRDLEITFKSENEYSDHDDALVISARIANVRQDPEITFKSENEYPDHDDTLVISANIANARVKRIIIDIGSSTGIHYFDVFYKLDMTNRDVTPMTSTLTGFTGDAITPIGIVILPMTFGDEPRTMTLMVPFMVVELPSAYNMIIGRPTLNKLRAIVSTYHRSMKIPNNARAGEVRSDPRESRQCYLAATIIPNKGKKETPVPDPREPDEPESRPESTKLILEVPLDKDRLEKMVRVGADALAKSASVGTASGEPSAIASIHRPIANGLAEVTNRSILEGQRRRRVTDVLTTWVDELLSVLWVLRTTPKTLTGESPYSMAFGIEVILSSEVVFLTLRVEKFTPEASKAGLRENLNFVEKRRAEAHLRTHTTRRRFPNSTIGGSDPD